MKRWFLVPPVVMALGFAWMAVAVAHFEQTTGRKFHGLAGYQSSLPENAFHPAPGSDAILKWSLEVPSATTAVLLVASGIGIVAMNRGRGFRFLLAWWLAIICCAIGLAAGSAWVAFNITGVFV